MRIRHGLGIATIVGALAATWNPPSSWAGETRFYVKSGYFSWRENLDGQPFVREEGWMHGAGVERRDLFFSRVSLGEKVEVWGGDLAYDGHDLRNTVAMISRTSYLGTREEVTVGTPVGAGKAVLEPGVGIGHKFWMRSRSGEDWNSVYLKGGLSAVRETPGLRLFVKGGALFPFFTRDHGDLSSVGLTDVVTFPKGAWSGFAEIGAGGERFALSLEYEGMRFDRSSSVAVRPAGNASGVAVRGGQAFQPDSRSDSFFLKLSYRY